MPYYKSESNEIFFFDTEELKEQFQPQLEPIEEEKAMEIANPPLSLDEVKAEKIKELGIAFDRSFANVSETPSDGETTLLSEQRAEAIAFSKNPESAEVPTLTIIAENRGISVNELVDKILVKIDDVHNKQAELLGKFQRLRDQVKDCNRRKQVEKITWNE